MSRHSLMTIAAFISLAPDMAGATSPSDRATIETLVESVGTLADRGEFEALERLFDDEVRVDYESLSGQTADLRSPSALMADWAALLPGFDATRHVLSNIETDVSDTKASATADVTASHWLGSVSWVVDGHYDYRFARRDDGWKITSMTFTLEAEQGSRALLSQAADIATAEPVPYLKRFRAQSVVRQFLTGLEEIDMEAVNAVWADDAVQEMPFAPKGVGFPDRVIGKDALIRQYAGWPDAAINPDYTSALRVYPTLDPNMVIAEFRGNTQIRTTGREYDQRYVGIFHVNDEGRIDLFREYFDPTVFKEAFDLGAECSVLRDRSDLLPPQNFNVSSRSGAL